MVLLRVGELPSAAGRDKRSEGLIRVRASHVQENIALTGLVKTLHLSSYRYCFANVLGRFFRRISCRRLSNG